MSSIAIKTLKTASIKEALQQLDVTAERGLIVVNEDNRLLGILTDGDVRRGLLQENSMDDTIENTYNQEPFYLVLNKFSQKLVEKKLLENRLQVIPIVDDNHKLVDYISWKNFESNSKDSYNKSSINGIPTVIMAGGKGTRLEHFSKIIPKPLIPF